MQYFGVIIIQTWIISNLVCWLAVGQRSLCCGWIGWLLFPQSVSGNTLVTQHNTSVADLFSNITWRKQQPFHLSTTEVAPKVKSVTSFGSEYCFAPTWKIVWCCEREICAKVIIYKHWPALMQTLSSLTNPLFPTSLLGFVTSQHLALLYCLSESI